MRLAQQLVREEPTAHADLAMNAPYRQVDAFRIECFLPRKNVLVHAVDQRSVEVEQE